METHPDPITLQAVWSILDEVVDPEIPVISLTELGVIRAVSLPETGGVTVTLTPTFSGCPAQAVMQAEVEAAVRQLGVEPVNVEVSLSPVWSSNWISPEGREKLRAFGLSPPPRIEAGQELLTIEVASCPSCGSTDTSLRNSFGPTLCRAIYTCNACQEPFEQFKPL